MFKFDDLIYRGSLYEYNFTFFIETCRHKSPTLMVARTIEGRVFGAVTDIPWQDDETWQK